MYVVYANGRIHRPVLMLEKKLAGPIMPYKKQYYAPNHNCVTVLTLKVQIPTWIKEKATLMIVVITQCCHSLSTTTIPPYLIIPHFSTSRTIFPPTSENYRTLYHQCELSTVICIRLSNHSSGFSLKTEVSPLLSFKLRLI